MVGATARQAIEASIELPTIPKSAARIRSLCQDPDADAAQVGEALAQDPPLSAKVLKYANSACYGLSQPVYSIQKGAAVLGTDAIANLVLQTEVFRQYSDLDDEDLGFDRLWAHSVVTALLARDLAGRITVQFSPDELYTCGLLHDLGKVALFKSLGQAYKEILHESIERKLPSYLLERRALDYTHTEVGALIAHQWGLPEGIQQAIECHHLPRIRLRDQPHTLIVSLANELARLVADGFAVDETRFKTTPIFRYLNISYPSSVRLGRTAAEYWKEFEHAF